MKTLADCDTGCIVQVEVQEGKAANKISDAAGVDGIVYQHHTAVSLRLTKPWWNSGRAVIGDSWFASVSNIIAHLQKDMYFVGNIKTATRGFCKNALTDKCGTADGLLGGILGREGDGCRGEGGGCCLCCCCLCCCLCCCCF